MPGRDERAAFVRDAVLALIAGGQRGEYAQSALDGRVWAEGYCEPPEKVLARDNEFADALYGPEEQVDGDEVRELREAFVDVYNWIAEITDDPTCPPSKDMLMCAQEALAYYPDLYNECRRVLRGEDDDAS